MKTSVVTVGALDQFLILTPERYIGRDHRGDHESGIILSDIAAIRRETVTPARGIEGGCRVADTGDAEEGILKLDRPATDSLGSNKKRLRAGDVIISRLRPYLRQVAYVDHELFAGDVDVVGSTEFYVLRSLDDEPISFLVPWLLGARVQSALAASLEGAHHPRFHDSTLMQLRVPSQLLDVRARLSAEVEDAIRNYRAARRGLSGALAVAEDAASLSEQSE